MAVAAFSRKRPGLARDAAAPLPATPSPTPAFLEFASQAYDASALRHLYASVHCVSRTLSMPYYTSIVSPPALACSAALEINHEHALVLNRGLYALLTVPMSRFPLIAPALEVLWEQGLVTLGTRESTVFTLSLAETAARFVETRSLAINGCTTHVWVWAAERSDLAQRLLPVEWLVSLVGNMPMGLPLRGPPLRDAFCQAVQLRARWNHALLGALEQAAGCSFRDLLPHVLQYSD